MRNISKEEWDASNEEMKKSDVCDMEDFGRLERSEKTIAILGDRWPQTATQGGDRINKTVIYGRSAMSAEMLEVSLVGVGTVLRLEMDAWSMVK